MYLYMEYDELKIKNDQSTVEITVKITVKRTV